MFDLAAVSFPAPTLLQIVLFLFSLSELDGVAEAVLCFPCWLRAEGQSCFFPGGWCGKESEMSFKESFEVRSN